MPDDSVRLRDHAYTSFTEKLLARDIAPGQFVSQRELVELTGMPLGAIREMIPRLEADGLIRTSPKRGLQVLSIDMDLIRDAFQLRRIVEGEAFAQFCDTAADADLARIAAEHTAIRKAADHGVTEDLLDRAQRMDWAFHDHVVDHMGNRIISDIHRVNAIKIRLIRNADTRMLPELVISVMDEHMAIVEALLARNRERTIAAIHAHVDSAKNLRQCRDEVDVQTPADLAGINLRMPGTDAWQFLGRALGANPTPIAFTEIYTALQTGSVDGQDNPLPTVVDAKFYEVTCQIALTSHLVDLNYVAFSKAVWDSLTPEQQTTVEQAAVAAADAGREAQLAKEEELVAYLSENGLELYEPDVAAFRNHVQEQYVGSEFAAAWPEGVLDQINALGN